MEGRVGMEAPATSSRDNHITRVGSRDASEILSGSGMGDLAILDSKESGDGSAQLTGTPPEALFYVLPYLGLKELLTFETVSRQLRDAIRGDVLLWQQLHVDVPLNRNFSNVELGWLSSRAQGRLQSLSLVKCTRISKEDIETVLAVNPLLQKLSLPGCTRVSAEAILRMVKVKSEGRSLGAPGLTQLRIRGLYGVTAEILDSLQSMIQPESGTPSTSSDASPQYYKNGETFPAFSEERAIDIETCPKCRRPGLVFDCTRETCKQRRSNPLLQCRGCYLCIARCEECGTCIDASTEEYEETICLEFVCPSCWLRLPKCSECNQAACSRHSAETFQASLANNINGSFTCGRCQGLWREPGPAFDEVY